MIKDKKIWLILIIFIFGLLFLTPITSALNVTSININQNYANVGGNVVYTVFVTVDDSNGVSSIPLLIHSDKQATDLDFNAIFGSGLPANTFEADFYLDFTSDTSSTSSNDLGSWPKVIVNAADTITVSLKSNSSINNTMIVDSVSPVIGSITQIVSLGSSSGDYYKGDANISLLGYSDVDTYVDHYLIYIVPVDKVDTFSSDYSKKIVTDDNSETINLDIATGLADGNYFVVVDGVDVASNNGNSTDVENTKINMYIDNSAPVVGSFNLGNVPITNASVYYIDTNTFDINITNIVDSGVGINTLNQSKTYISVRIPNGALMSDMNNYINFNTDINGFHVPIDSSYEDGNLFHVVFDVSDLLDNSLYKDFNIMIDSKGPTTPTKPTLTRTIDNNITITSWGTSTDTGSGLKEYKVYRSTSDFTKITNQTLICTVDASSSKFCVDSTSKSDDETYYYGVVAIDKLGNLSDVETDNIKTGPKFSFNIVDIENGYTNLTKPTIDITLDSDINEIRFSCNGSTFTSWVTVSGSSELYTDFDITSGNGCNSDNGLKTIYVQAKSSDSPYLESQKTDTIRYDNTPPVVPLNVSAVPQLDGSLKLTWTKSSDSGIGLEKYFVYYSTSSPVTTTDKYYISLNNSYNFRPNEDGNYSIRIVSIDKLGNTSALSSEVSGITKRVGPTFSLTINPQVDVNGTNYVKGGNTKFTINSDETLKSAPSVSLKIGNGVEIDLTPSFSNNIATVNYNLTTSGLATFKVTGVNEKNEQASSTFNFVIDANVPTFDVNYTIDKSIYNFDINGYPDDVTKVQYILDNTNSLCIITSSDYNCSFDSIDYNDGDHTVSVLVYDKALNVGEKNITINVDNINEVEIAKEKLVESVNNNFNIINSNMDLYNAISINLSKNLTDKFQEIKQKQHEIKQLQDSNDMNIDNSAILNKLYTEQNNLLLELSDSLPKITIVKNKTISTKYDSNYSFDLNTIISDENILNDTNKLYNSNIISVDRNFEVIQIENNKYYLINIIFNNNSDTPQTITFIETIPKDIASNVSGLLFNSKVDIINKDPIIKHIITIPAKSSFKFEYTKKDPITNFDTVSKFDLIKFESPIILAGDVNSENINIVVPSNDIYILFIILVVILLLLIIVVAISSKKKKKTTLGLDINKSKEEALSGKLDNNLSGQTQNNISKEDDITKNNSFQSNYDYIVDAVKRNDR